jgi:hypothetical protein
MKNKKLVITAAVLAVLICLLITGLLFYAVAPKFLIILAFSFGIITGVLITLLIVNLVNMIKGSKNEK